MNVRFVSALAQRILPGLVLMVGLATAPLLAMPVHHDDGGRFVGSEMEMSSGAGFVIMVSLQRAD